MLSGMFKFKTAHGFAWLDLESVDVFVSIPPDSCYSKKVSKSVYLAFLRHGKTIEIISTEQELDEVVKQYWID